MKAKSNQKKRVSKVDDKSQTFSMDILIALGIFIVGIVVFLYLIGGNPPAKLADKLLTESEILPQRLIAPDDVSAINSTIVIGNRVDGPRLNKSLKTNYTDLKNTLDIVSDFCVHMEDENGILKDLDDDPCWVQYSIGNSRLTLVIQEGGVERNVPCGNRTYIC